MTSLTTALSRAECDERIQGRLDRRALTLRLDPARPVRGRSSIQGFALHHPRDSIVDALGTYLLGSQGGTRIDVFYRFAWGTQLGWIATSVVALGIVGGLAIALGSGRTDVDPFIVLSLSIALAASFVLLLDLVLVVVAWLVFGPRQRAYLRKFLEDTLAAR